MTLPAIELTGVSKGFVVPHEQRLRLKEYAVRPFRRSGSDWICALDGVSLRIEPGECFGVIGNNGSGKSTLLRVVSGIYRPDHGVVRVRGKVSPFIELGVGFNPELTARENIEINATLLGLTRAQIADRFDSILAFAQLERFVDQQLKNFSSGMLMRLAYSIAVQVPFDILVLDEVLAVGDISFQEKCFQHFHRLREERKTVVFVSHNLHAIRNHCDRVGLLEQGRVAAIGRPDEVVELYERRELAALDAKSAAVGAPGA